MAVKKIGVLGCGMIAELGHMPALKHVSGLSLHAVYDVAWSRALAMQAKFQIPHAFPTEKAFWESDLDAVVICTPAPFHLANVLNAAKHGKHVLCEKPLAMNEADIQRMINTMTDAGLMLFTGFTYRFSGAAQEIHRLVRSGAIGEVRALRLVYLWNLHGNGAGTGKGNALPARCESGECWKAVQWWIVVCIRSIWLAGGLGSEVVWQRSIGVWAEDYLAPDHMYLHMGHQCGAHTMVEMSFSYNATSREPRTHFQYELIGTDGVIRLNREEHSFELRNSHGTQWLAWHPEKNFWGMHAEFSHVLSTSQLRNMPTANDGLLATRIAGRATEEAIRDREFCSKDHPSTMAQASGSDASGFTTVLDLEESDEPSASILSTLIERTKQ